MKSVRNGTLVCLLAAGLAVASLSTPKAQSRIERRTTARGWSPSHIGGGTEVEGNRGSRTSPTIAVTDRKVLVNQISSKFNSGPGAPAAMDGYFAPTSGVSSGISVDTRTTATAGTTANVYFGMAGGTVNSIIVRLAQQF